MKSRLTYPVDISYTALSLRETHELGGARAGIGANPYTLIVIQDTYWSAYGYYPHEY